MTVSMIIVKRSCCVTLCVIINHVDNNVHSIIIAIVNSQKVICIISQLCGLYGVRMPVRACARFRKIGN